MSTASDPGPSQVRLLSASEFAAAIGKTERQVYRYVKKGRVAALMPEETGLPGVRIPEAELEKFHQRFGAPDTSGWVRPRVGAPRAEWEDGLEESVETEPAEAPSPSLVVPLERHEAAVMRLGYLESQLEQTRRMLVEGDRQESDRLQRLETLEADLQSAQTEVLRAQVKAEVEAEARAEAESRARSLALRLEEAERQARAPWWKRLFGQPG